MRNEHFCDSGQKYTPETITFIRFWATFPQAWFFIMISFCRKKISFAEFYFPDSFFNFLENLCFYEKKHLKKAYLFLGLEHDPSPFRRQEHMGNVIFRILLQKVEIIPFWLPNRRIIKFPNFWSKRWHFRPHGANPYKRNGFLGLLGPIFLIFRFWGEIPQL